jgi:hypothetical protein
MSRRVCRIGSLSIYDGGMTSEPDPPWVRDAARAVGHELAAYFVTLWAIASAPARFAAEWSDGRRPALNPLAFLLNSLAVVGPWRAIWARLLDPNPPTTPLWFEIGKPMLPVLISLVVTSWFHVLAVALGARRPLRSSMAITMYVSGGPLAILNFFTAPVVLYGFINRFSPVGLWAVLVNFALLAAFFVYLVIAEAALHRLSRWRVTLAAVVAWFSFGAFSAWVSLHHPELVRSMLSG